MVDKPDIDGLRDFAGEPDRHLTPFFAGRESETARIRQMIDGVRRRVAEGVPAPAEGRLTLITGVPGAGKTSLMAKLMLDWRQATGKDGTTPLAVMLALSQFQTATDFRRALETKFETPLYQRWLQRLGGEAVAVGLPVLVETILTAAGASMITNALSKITTPPLGELESGRWKVPAHPIVLFIDEIQNIALYTNRDEGPAACLRTLQEGVHGYPVIPVVAGLAHARDQLEQAGLSRLATDAVLPLGCLSPEEVRQSMALFFDCYRVIGDRESWTETVIRRSDGWPKHVQNSQTALAAGLVAAAGNLDQVDAQAVHRLTAKRRIVYYSERTAGALTSCPVLLGRVMEAIGPIGADKGTCIDKIWEHARPDGKTAERIPDELGSATALFNAMVAKGLLQGQADGDEYYCPIPSMRSWCAARAGSPLHTSTLALDRARVEERLRSGTVDVDARDLRGRTPLHIAAEENMPAIAELLLAAGADTTTRDLRGRTPLAAAGERETEVRTLLKATDSRLCTDSGKKVSKRAPS